MARWLIPMIYAIASLACGLVVPRLESTYLSAHTVAVSPSSALSFFSAVGSGMIAPTGIFAITFRMNRHQQSRLQ